MFIYWINNSDVSIIEEQNNISKERIIAVLQSIYDYEIPIDIYELGLIYDIKIIDQVDVKIIMTLTSPNCPVANYLLEEVKRKIQDLGGVRNVEIDLTFDPPWNPSMLSEAARFKLDTL